MYLVDTDILSTGAPGRRERSAALSEWMNTHSDSLFLSAITIAEICSGIARLRRTGASAKAERLDDWLELVLHLYDARIIRFDVPAARQAGLLMDRERAAGRSPGFADIAIAAIAADRSLTVLTRNLRHFRPLGVPAMNPLETLPE
ncbi:MAG: PIN domain-containing protein [Alphaproteobacteria bacterium]|nr:PIN domain-containing protein [Alphaproteobacteria bacterium]